MSRHSEEELKPRNGHTLIVGTVCRISGCENQKEESLDDQEDNVRDLVNDLYDGPFEIRVIASTKDKGEALDRPELEKVEDAYKSGDYDLIAYDELSRLIRGGEAVRLLGIGVDHGTRSICIKDTIDTVDSTWEEDALTACSENVAFNERTSRRIKQKTMNRFRKSGWPTGRPIAGYIVPEDHKSYDDWCKDETAVPIILEGCKILRRELDYAPVADFFNEQGFPLGPYCRRKAWNGTMVRRLYSNPILKGMPQRGLKHTVKNHATGRRVSVKNPKGPNYYPAPHLAHLTADEFDELNSLLNAKNACHRRMKVNGVDPLFRRSRSNSRFPGLHARCWYCGYHCVWGGNGITENLMCSHAREWQCWHSIAFSGPVFAEKLVAEIAEQLQHLDQFDEQFAALVATAGSFDDDRHAAAWKQLKHEEDVAAREKKNLLAAIKSVGHSQMLKDEVAAIEAAEQKLLLRRHKLEHHRVGHPKLPESPSRLGWMLKEELGRLTIESPAFGSLMRSLVPEVYVYSVRLCDGGHLLPRAKVKLNLAGTFPDVNLVPGLGDLLTQELTLDLFDPPQRERIREEAVRLAGEPTNLGPKAISRRIAERPTSTAVQNALALHRMVVSRGIDNPYVIVLEPPEDYPKVRRHKHSRYAFQPMDGYQRPEL